jgi:cytochrome c biogenesis protein CcmG, thiol:disulfide interchange protein DsbE
MSTRRTTLAGLVSGVFAALVLVVALVAFVPDPPIPGAAQPGGSPAQEGTPTGTRTPLPSALATSPQASPGSEPTAFHIGKPAPRLVVPQLGGGTIDLGALRGKPVWVNFMATWCAPCRDEFPVMNRFAVQHAEDGLVVLAIDVREDEGTVADFARALNARFPMGLDLEGSAQDTWNAFFLPVHFWIDAEGIVREGALGGIGPDLMAQGLARIMPGVEVNP